MKSIKLSICAVVLLLLSAGSSYAQCSFDTDKKDDFTGENVRSSRVRIGTLLYSWWLLMEQKGTKYYMTVQSASTGKVDDIIPKGSKILFKLENGKVVEMIVTEDCVPSHSVQSNTIVSMWLPKGELTKETMQQISESGISLIRMSIGGKDFNSPEPTNKETRKTRELAECMVKG
jgi:hypothetical protein